MKLQPSPAMSAVSLLDLRPHPQFFQGVVALAAAFFVLQLAILRHLQDVFWFTAQYPGGFFFGRAPRLYVFGFERSSSALFGYFTAPLGRYLFAGLFSRLAVLSFATAGYLMRRSICSLAGEFPARNAAKRATIAFTAPRVISAIITGVCANIQHPESATAKIRYTLWNWRQWIALWPLDGFIAALRSRRQDRRFLAALAHRLHFTRLTFRQSFMPVLEGY